MLQVWSRQIFQRLLLGNKKDNERSMINVVPRDAIMSLENPQLITAAGAAAQMVDHERVIGLEINNDCRAYPINILSVHQVINDTVGGVPVVICWCPLSYSAVVYKRIVMERELTFGVSGKILRNVTVLYDRHSETYWNQICGEAFAGPLSGCKLERVPFMLTRWRRFRDIFPQTLTVCKSKCPYQYYEDDHMSDYYNSPRLGIRNPLTENKALALKEVITGSFVNEQPFVYPKSLLEQVGVINDHELKPVVFFYDESGDSCHGYYASLKDYTLTFYQKDGHFFDEQTKSSWSPLAGVAVNGPLCGLKLKPLIAVTAFWFAYADHYANIRVYQLHQH